MANERSDLACKILLITRKTIPIVAKALPKALIKICNATNNYDKKFIIDTTRILAESKSLIDIEAKTEMVIKILSLGSNNEPRLL